MKTGVNIIGILVALTGLVFFLQGIGVLQGSSMSNQTQWVVIGFIIILIAVVLLTYNNRHQIHS